MLKPQKQSSRAQHSQTRIVPAPIGGLNARDALASMDPKDAVILDNLLPRTGDVQSRKGYASHVTGLPGQVNTLMAYNGVTAFTMFAASSTGIYNVTSAGAVGAAVVSGITSDKFEYINISTAGGKYLWSVNGSDLAQMYDGSTWSNPAVTGVLSSAISHVNLWGNRIIMVQKNTMSIWYLPLNSISGAASEINLGSLFKKGGRIILTANWTIDGGTGVDDALLIITSRGEVAVYRGGDPSTAAGFVKSGVYEVGAPIGNRFYAKYGGDAVLITLDGFEPLSASLTSTRTNNKIAISDKISGLVSQSTSDYKDNFGWEVINFPSENMLIFNVPVSAGTENHQYVMNTITGAWCRFKGWNANCFCLMNDELYFGSNGTVRKAWQGNSDAGTNISIDAKTAFNYFDNPQNKIFKLARLIISANANPSFTLGLNLDYDDVDNTTATTFSGAVSLWDTALWDVGVWGGQAIYKDWQSLNGIGGAAAVRVKLLSNELDLRWSATEYVFENGGVI